MTNPISATEKISLFLKPFSSQPFQLALFVFRFTLFGAFWGVVLSFLLAELSKLLLSRDADSFESLVIVFGVSLSAYFGIVWLIRRTGTPYLRAGAWKFFHSRYLPKILELDHTYAESLWNARIFSILDRGGQAWLDALSELFEQSARILVALIPTIFLLVDQPVQITVLMACCFAVVGLYVVMANRRLIIHKSDRVTAVTEYDRRLIRAIHSRFEIIQNSALKSEIAALDGKNDRFFVPFRALVWTQTLIFQWIRFFGYVMIAGVYWMLWHDYLQGGISLPNLILLWSLIGVLMNLLYDLAGVYIGLTDSFANIDQLWEKLDKWPKTRNLTEGDEFRFSRGGIKFNDVDFSYVWGNGVLSGFSYAFEAWKRYALVGESGGGKSTVMKLASGFLFPTSGSVKIDGFDTKTVNLSTLYPHIGYLSQDPSVFDGTIRDNLAYGSQSEATEEQIRSALEKAEASFVFQFPEGLDTEIGERGVKLSGGQKQRLAIAKTFLKNPSVLFLDEPTSALDSLSEEAITKSFEGLFENKTVLIIAHRLKTVQQADVILVIENGAVAESGTHSELLEKNGKYARMLAAQTHF